MNKQVIERPNQRGIYFLRTHYSLNLKRLWVDQRSGNCWLVSSNPAHPDLVYSKEDTDILGVMIGWVTWVR